MQKVNLINVVFEGNLIPYTQSPEEIVQVGILVF